MLAVMMAGGRGTRVASVSGETPKPLLPVCGKPVLEREIECLRDQGIREILLTVGYKGDAILEHFGNGGRLGVRIAYYREKEPLGNAGALFRVREELAKGGDDTFLLLNADCVFDVDFNRMMEAHRKKGADVTLFTHPNSHPYDSGLILASPDGAVERWLTKEEERPKWYQNRVNAGIHLVNVSVLDGYLAALPDAGKATVHDAGVDGNREAVAPVGKVDLDRDLLRPLAGTGRMYVYDSPEYVRDMGTPERYQAVCRDFEKGVVAARNLSRPQKAVFLDRDGTINRHRGFLTRPDEFELLPGVGEAIRKINASGYLAIVATNQPAVARGELTFAGLREIHDKMEALLGREGAYLDGIYFCPHHPQKGFAGEIPELKVECGCRKPKPGMLLRAAEDFHIDLRESWVVGDGGRDVQAGKNAGCRTAFIGDGGLGGELGADLTGGSLLELVGRILGE